jgi:hypothetical protein
MPWRNLEIKAAWRRAVNPGTFSKKMSFGFRTLANLMDCSSSRTLESAVFARFWLLKGWQGAQTTSKSTSSPHNSLLRICLALTRLMSRL